MKNRHPDSPEFAGDYNLDSINLIGNDGNVIDIKRLVAELNIFESIYSNSVTGSVVITDTLNLIARLPLQGTERIAFKLSTPGVGNDKDGVIDASIKTGIPFHIYKLSNREQISEGIIKYVLHFCSKGMVRNIRTKVSQAYTGPLHEAVANICTDKSYLDCRQRLYYEPTRNKTTIVIPNMRPLDAVNLIASKSLSKNTKGAGYYFYETTKGYYFRSWENMVATQGKFPRKVAAVFDYVLRNIQINSYPIKGARDAAIKNMEAVRNYSFVNNYDSLAQQAMGTYAHRVITHNIYDKSYDIKKYNYHAHYADHQHADLNSANKYPIMDVPVDFDQKSVSEYDESFVTLQPTTQYLHNKETGPLGTDVEDAGHTEATRVTQLNSVGNGIKLHLEVSGHSWLQAGDVIFFQLRTRVIL